MYTKMYINVFHSINIMYYLFIFIFRFTAHSRIQMTQMKNNY